MKDNAIPALMEESAGEGFTGFLSQLKGFLFWKNRLPHFGFYNSENEWRTACLAEWTFKGDTFTFQATSDITQTIYILGE